VLGALPGKESDAAAGHGADRDTVAGFPIGRLDLDYLNVFDQGMETDPPNTPTVAVLRTYSCGRGGRHQKCRWSEASRARSAIARITPAPTDPASWIVSSISSSVAPSFFAPAKWETAQGSQ
jgi:hypothetical protein